MACLRKMFIDFITIPTAVTIKLGLVQSENFTIPMVHKYLAITV